jgi:hypothetical protein
MDMAGGQRFNPPPGWPPAPAGWTPPPGWTPPADWPPLPPGWQLWLPATGPASSPPLVRAGALPWYRRTWGTLLLLAVFFPAGLFLMWRRQSWGRATKWSLTAATAVFVTIALASGGSSPSPAADHPSAPATPVSSSAPATASRAVAALPDTAPATSKVAATTPASHRPSAPPPHTSKASAIVPAPISTTPVQSAPASSCHPLTNAGNCYEPGQTCRKSDHGVDGVAGNGERIVCAYNNGWRWEPV